MTCRRFASGPNDTEHRNSLAGNRCFVARPPQGSRSSCRRINQDLADRQQSVEMRSQDFLWCVTKSFLKMSSSRMCQREVPSSSWFSWVCSWFFLKISNPTTYQRSSFIPKVGYKILLVQVHVKNKQATSSPRLHNSFWSYLVQ